MGTILDRLPEKSRVAIIRLRSMGDSVLTTPALHILKQTRPDLKIAVVVEDRFAPVFEGNSDLERILPPSFGAVMRWRPRLALNFHGGVRSMELTLASLAQIRAGFGHHRGAWMYSDRIPRAQQILGEERTVHTAEHLASAMFWLGCPIQDVPRAQLCANPAPSSQPYAVLHPASAAAYKTWDAKGFLKVAHHLRTEAHLEPVFIGSSKDDLTPFAGFRVLAGAHLTEVKSLLAGAALFVGNDSGPAHMAAALSVPVVVLFGRLDHLLIWSPWRAVAARTLASPAGISAITPREVIEAVDAVLSETGSRLRKL